MGEVGFFRSVEVRNRVHQLDRDFRRTREAVEARYQQRPSLPAEPRASFVALERAWVAYRDELSTDTLEQMLGNPLTRIAEFERALIAQRRKLARDIGLDLARMPAVREPARAGVPWWAWAAGGVALTVAAVAGAAAAAAYRGRA